MTIRLRTLGSLDLRSADGREIRSLLAQPKRLALLVYLAASPTPLHRRDTLLALFWPESDQDSARASLRTALSVLRRSLGEGVVVGRGTEEVGVDPERLWCDAAAFEQACAAGDAERALQLHRGVLLEGFHVADAPEFERWLEQRRHELRRRAAEAAWRLVERQPEGDPEAARWARHAAALTPDDEGSVRRLITLLDRMGDRAGALRSYEEFVERLRTELEVDPAPETQALARRIRAREPGQATAPETSDSRVEGPTVGAPGSAPDQVVEVVDASAALPDAIGEPLPASRGARRGVARARRVRFAVVAVLGSIAVTLAGGYRAASPLVGSDVAPPVAEDRVAPAVASIAVLPFADMSADGDQAYLADGTAEEIIQALTRVGELRVAARTSAFSFRGRDRDIREIARDLGVDAVVEGSVRRVGNRIRITAQLIDARSGYHRWSETYDRDAGDIFAIQDEIAHAVVTTLNGRPTDGGRKSLASRRTQDADAYDHYLRGIHFLKRGSSEDLLKAVQQFRAAIARDTTFAAAYAGLVDTYIQFPTIGLMDPRGAFDLARPAAQRAVELGPDLAIAHASLGRVHLEGDWNFAAAQASYERAARLEPAHELHFRYPLFLATVGRLPEAIEVARRTVAADPLAVTANSRLGLLLYYDHQHDAAVAVLRRTLELEPTYFYTHWYLGLAYLQAGRLPEAIRSLQTATELSGGSPLVRATLGCAYARAGRTVEARRIRDELVAGTDSLYLRPQGLIFLLAELGEREEAFRRLEASVADRSILPYVLAGEPLLDGLRGDPRFTRLLAGAGLR